MINVKSLTKMVGYYVSWTEYESGWGCRPDGYHFYATSEIATAETKKILENMRAHEAATLKAGVVPYDYSSPDNMNNPKMVLITPEIAKEIEEKGVSFRKTLPYKENGQPREYYSHNYPNETFSK